MVKICTDKQMQSWRDKTDERIEQILCTPNMSIPQGAPVYYVSNGGCDDNDGLSQDTPWQTLDKVNNTAFMPGTVVQFRRGDSWRGQIRAKTGVTYTAYGCGDKPKLYGSPMDGADPTLWELTDTVNIWRYKGWQDGNIGLQDIGTIVCDHGKTHGIKAIIRYEKDGSHWNNTTGERFRSWRDLTADMHFYHDLSDGSVYLHSTENPGKRFTSIEFSIKRHGLCHMWKRCYHRQFLCKLRGFPRRWCRNNIRADCAKLCLLLDRWLYSSRRNFWSQPCHTIRKCCGNLWWL